MGKVFNIVGEGGHSHESSACSAQPNLTPIASTEGVAARQFRGKAAVITLGCAKNQVDSEVMLGALRKQGFDITTELSAVEVAVVNTCGFLQSSVKESIDCILNVADYKKTGRLRKLIVAGCLVERYRDDLKKSIPEVDSFITIDDLLKVGDVADGNLEVALDRAARPYFLYDDTMPRELSTRSHTAYVKVAEGCNRPCTFCIIPKLRGGMRSRPVESVVQEVKMLGGAGVQEVNLVAQDLTDYGTDRKGPNLSALLRALNDTESVRWIRMLYAYPIGINEELLDTVAALPRVCKYLDLPLQHASESVLKAMKRPIGKYSPRNIVEFIRNRQPSIALRTTFIVGFPGETEQDVDELEALIRAGHFTNVGIFTYSPEEGTPSFDLPGQLPEKTKSDRRKRLMLAQQEVNAARLSAMIGTTIDVLVEGTHEDTDLIINARAEWQAPDVDGIVMINDLEVPSEQVVPGAFGKVKITEVSGYDLVGTLVSLESGEGRTAAARPMPDAASGAVA